MDLQEIIRRVLEISQAADTRGSKVDEQLADIQKHAKEVHARLHELEQRGTLNDRPGNDRPATINLGKIIAGDAKLAQFRSGDARHIVIPVNHSLRVITRALLTNAGASGDSPAYEYPVNAELLPGGPRGFAARRLSVLEALPTVPVSTAVAEVPKLVSNTDNAGVQQDEGDAKSETVLNFENEQLRHATIAHFVNASKQVIADSPLLQSFINRVMMFGVMKKFENLVVAGNGTTDKIAGLTVQGTPFVGTKVGIPDMVGESMASLISDGYSPDLAVLNVFDWFDAISEKDGEGRYIAGGWWVPMPNQMWGLLRAVPSAALPAGTGIVLDSQQVAVLDREQANVSIGYTGDQFKENEVTILAELRGQLAVYDPSAVNVITFAS